VNEGERVKPITDRRRREQQPDVAALEELRKAFGVRPADAATTGTISSEDAAGDLDATGAATAAVPVTDEAPTQATAGDPEASSVDAPAHPGEVEQPEVEPPAAPTVEQAHVEQAHVEQADVERAEAEQAERVTVDEPKRDEPEPPEPEPPEPEQPRIIRIDDYAASLAEPQPTAGAPGPAVDPLIAHPPKPSQPPERTVIAIEADDLPDAVYVEGSLESGGTGSIVFIEDDVASDVLTPESDRDLRRGIEPRMRERRLAVKRAQGRKRLRWLVAALVLVILGVAALATFGSSLFAIRADQVTLTGNVYTDPQRLQAVIDDLVGTPVLTADTQKAERDLEAIPWVEDAKVTTHFPHGVSIEIRERAPVATFQGPDQKYRVLDRDGRVLDVLDGYPFAYVLISGPDPVNLDPSEIAPQGYKAAAELAKNLTTDVRGKVDHIEVTADGSRLVMYLDDGTEVRFGEARDLFTKLVRLETVLLTNPDREPGTIDVSTSQTTL
jgi:cell division protein FtsQ